MGMIGRWIDEKCAIEPDVMRRVLNRKFGDLGMFFERDKCGCLVGSWAIEGNKALQAGGGRPADPIAEAVGEQVNDLTISHARCMRFSPKRWTKRTDEFVIRLLKQRIRKSLGIAPTRETAVSVGAGPTTETPQP